MADRVLRCARSSLWTTFFSLSLGLYVYFEAWRLCYMFRVKEVFGGGRRGGSEGRNNVTGRRANQNVIFILTT